MQLAHYGVGLEALRAAIGTVNVNQPKGYLQDDSRRWSVSATDQLFGAAAYAPLIVATDRGPVSSAAARTGLPASVASAHDEQSTGGSGGAGSTEPELTAANSPSAAVQARLPRNGWAGLERRMAWCGFRMWRRWSTAWRTFMLAACSTASRRFW